jgi:hypothetical protein
MGNGYEEVLDNLSESRFMYVSLEASWNQLQIRLVQSALVPDSSFCKQCTTYLHRRRPTSRGWPHNGPPESGP